MRHEKKICILVICSTKRKYTIKFYAAQKENIQLVYMRHKKKMCGTKRKYASKVYAAQKKYAIKIYAAQK